MENKKKIASKIFWKIFLALFFGYSAIYISSVTGYYEFQEHKKVELTKEKIMEFEQDIKSGKQINVKNYMDEKEKDFTNNTSNMGLALSENIENITTITLNFIFDFFNNIFNCYGIMIL